MDILLGTPNSIEDIAAGKPPYSLNYLSDIQFDPRGQLKMVSGVDVINQNLGKGILTIQGASNLDSIFGSVIWSFIGQNLSDQSSYNLIKQTIINSCAYYITQYQDSTDINEQIAFVNSIFVKVNSASPMGLDVILNVTNAAGAEANIGFNI